MDTRDANDDIRRRKYICYTCHTAFRTREYRQSFIDDLIKGLERGSFASEGTNQTNATARVDKDGGS